MSERAALVETLREAIVEAAELMENERCGSEAERLATWRERDERLEALRTLAQSSSGCIYDVNCTVPGCEHPSAACVRELSA